MFNMLNPWNRKGHLDENNYYHPDVFISNRYRDRSFFEKNRKFTLAEVEIMFKVQDAANVKQRREIFPLKEIHHGHCHGCWTQNHAPEICKMCYCYDLDAKHNNWCSKVNCKVDKNSRETKEILEILDSHNFKNQYPEYFL